jgi:predicted ATPase/DNA-binding SARP family transcriptional activator
MRLRVTLLGTFRVSRGEADLPVPGARSQRLVARLALAGGRAVDPGVLAGAIWGEEPPADPVHALQALVSRLRRALGPGGEGGPVAQVVGGYRLAVEPADVDALRFEQLVAAGRDRLHAGDPSAALAALDEAVARWGEPVVVTAVAPAVATRLARLATEAVADLAEAEIALGRADAAAGRLAALLADRPGDERAAALLMDGLAAQGRQAEALAVFERVRVALADDLGADPGSALRERHLRLLRSDGDQRPVADAAGRGLRGDAVRQAPPGRDDGQGLPGGDRGQEDQRGQGAGRNPRGRVAGRTPPGAPARSGLPAPMTSFIGRDDDLARIGTLLGAGRLVTVLGPGGAGKTRLAVEAARRLEYRDGTWLIDLSSVTEAAEVGAAVLAGIGIRGAALFEVASRARDDLDVLSDELGRRESLLVVDNCEHLIDAVARLVSDLLARCAGLRVLATSREPLAVDGEALVPLGPLTMPEEDASVEVARRTAAVRLFGERASAVRPGFDVDAETLTEVLRVVRGLDGMPLALELAAARLRTLSLGELAAGLSDRFRLLSSGSRAAYPRHRTLRAVIAWSWDLLGEYERTVAERVSVLPGGVSPGSAVAVCEGTSVPEAEIPELLAALVDRSLLQLAPDAGRYRMLETIREYGLAELGAPAGVRDLAARHFAALAARLDPLLRGPSQLEALRELGAEYDNVLAALRQLCDTGDAAGALGLAVNLTWYWQMLGRHGDAAYWLGEAVAVPGARSDIAEGILLLNTIAGENVLVANDSITERRGQLRAITDRLLSSPGQPGFAGALTAVRLASLVETEASAAIIQRVADGPDVWLAGLAHIFRAQLAENEGRFDEVRSDVAAALEHFGRAGDRWGLATALPLRALLRQYDGDLDGARADLDEAKRLAREFGSLSLSDEIFIDLRMIELLGRLGETGRTFELIEATRGRALRSPSPEMAILLDALEGGLWVRAGDLDRARDLIELAEARLPSGGDHGQALVSGVRALLCLELGDGPGAAKALGRAYAGAVASGDMPILARVAVAVAGLAHFYGRNREVAVILGAAARLRGAHDRTDPQIRQLRQAAGFPDAYEAGWRLDRQSAVARVDPSTAAP